MDGEEQSATLAGDALAEYEAAEARYRGRRQRVEDGPGNRQEKGGRLRGLAMEHAAERRRIAGLLTEKEQKAAREAEARMSTGSEVVVTADGREVKGTVLSTPFGRVKVRTADGDVTVERDAVRKGRLAEPVADESRAAAQDVEPSGGESPPTAPPSVGEVEVEPPAGPAPLPVREEDEAFDAYLGRARRALVAEADDEIEAAAREAGEDADPGAVAVSVAETTENPATALRGWRAAREAEAARLDSTRDAEAAIADYLPMLDARYMDDVAPDATAGQRRAYFRRASGDGGRTVDGNRRTVMSPEEAAAAVSDESGMPVTGADVVAFVRAYPNGPDGFRAEVRRPRRRIEDRLRELTGGPISRKRVEGYLVALDGPAMDPQALNLADATLGEILTAPPGENPTGYGSRNRLVNEDAYRTALATLGRTAPFSNPAGDPAVWKAAVSVASYHIEALAREGVDASRRFVEFSARTLRDLGRDFEPYLRQLWDEASPEVEAAVGPVEVEFVAGAPETRASETPEDAAPAPLAQEAARTAGGPPAGAQEAETGGGAPAPEPTPASGDDVPPESLGPDPGEAAPFFAAVLTQAEVQRARNALGLADLGPAQRRTWEATLAEVVRSGLHLEAEGLARSMVSEKGRPPFSAREHVAVLVALARAQRSYRETAGRVREVEAAGGPTEELQRDAARHLETVDLLTEAGRRSGTEAGTALAVRRLRLAEEAGRFTIAHVLDDARVLKGAALTDEERTRLAELAEQVEALAARVQEAEDAAARARADADRAAAERAVEAERERAEKEGQTRARREARRHGLREERSQILDDLGRLGLRVNDVTGLTAEGSVLVARLARNLAAEFGLTLAETVDRVRALLPDVAEADVIRALGREELAGAPKRRQRGPEEREAARAEKALNAARVEEARAKKGVRAAQAQLAPRQRGDLLASIAGLPRSVLATGDMSAVGNQAAPLIRRHPMIAARTFADAFQTFFSSYEAERLDLTIRSDPRQPKREAAGLYLAPQGEGAEAAKLTDREETFMSRLAERSPWLARAVVGAGVGSVTFGPGLGTATGAAAGVGAKAVMQASENHMVSFLNLLRVRVFDAWADAHRDATLEELAGYARVVNLLTGRGELSEGLARAGGWLLFSPRLTAARFQVLGAVLKPETPRAARLEALSSLVALVGVNAAILALADAVGEDETDVGLDPRSSDFGKLRWGSLRVDLFGGYSQVARLATRGVLAGTDAYGVTERPADRRDIDPLTEVGRFANAKKAPWIGVAVSLLTGKDFLGDPIAPHEVAAQALTPIGVQGTKEAAEADAPLDSNAARAATVFTLNFFGLAADAYLDPTQRATVLPFFERAHLTPRTSAPDGLDEEGRETFEREYRTRLAEKVEAQATALRRVAEPDALAERLKALKADAREEAAGIAEGDPLRQGAALRHLRRADYRPSAGRTQGLTARQREARADSFATRLAGMIDGEADALERVEDAEVLRDRLSDLAERARAEVDADPLAPALPWLQWADYEARAYPPDEMPEEKRPAYEADFARRLTGRIEAEEETLARYGDNREGLKERLRWHAAEARREAREAAGY